MRSPRLLVAVGGLLGLLGCQDPDVGQACALDLAIPQPVVADYLETGKTECENLVCIESPPAPAGSKVKQNPGYCSKACVSNSDCSESDTGLVCRAVVLDPNFINSLDPAVRQKFLGDITLSNYCAPPLP